jgi:regulator of protease activity HflC (stomatin/prohibitin superfamily)
MSNFSSSSSYGASSPSQIPDWDDLRSLSGNAGKKKGGGMNFGKLSLMVIGGILVCYLILIPLFGWVIIEDGQVGVKKVLGHISDSPVPSGLHFYWPIISSIENWDTKTKSLPETADVPSSEGLVASLDVSVVFNVGADTAPLIRKQTGKDYVTILVEPYFRQSIRTVVSGYPIKSLYSEQGRVEISKNILKMLIEELGPRHITVQDVLLRSVKLPKVFSDSIESKMQSEQQALQKEFELQKAKKDAEIMVAKANGVAEANRIISGSITEPYLRYLWIDGIKTENNQIIYVPTEACMPILEAGRGLKAPVPNK